MKQNRLCLLGICAAAVLVLTGCGENKSLYDKLNAMARQEYSEIELRITTITNGETLTGTYTATAAGNAVNFVFTYELFNLIEEADGQYVLPESAVSEYSGRVTLINGEITESEGESADISFETMTASGISFQKSYFDDIAVENDCFSASVVDPAGFLGVKDFSAINMKVFVVYGSDVIRTLAVSYFTSAFSSVTLLYFFSV